VAAEIGDDGEEAGQEGGWPEELALALALALVSEALGGLREELREKVGVERASDIERKRQKSDCQTDSIGRFER
jgi:hypothetical protein